MKRFFHTDNDPTTLIIRLMTGLVFLSEGIQKFLFPEMYGPGRFAAMGFPDAAFWAWLVATFEVLCGILLPLGLAVRAAALAMLVNMTVAIVVTKIPIALGESFGPFVLRELKSYGFWSMAHEMRTDFTLWLGSLFLLIKGGGRWSFDRKVISARQTN